MTAVLPAALQSYLTTCSSEHAEQIIQELRGSQQRRNAGKQTSDAAPGTKVTTSVTVGKTEKKQRNKKAKRRGATGGPKRPLNSWMAFRKYYSASLSPHTQKAISKILMSWWRADPFTAKWALLAKAYSIIRGSREKEEAPLDAFFHICVPLIGVIPPSQYQQQLGWTLGASAADDREQMPQITRIFVPSFDTFPEKLTTTNLSVSDLVDHCMAAGYVSTGNDDSPNVGTHGALTMAVASATATTFAIASPAAATAVGTESRMILGEDGKIAEPLSPCSRDLAQSLEAAIAEAAAAGAAEPAGKTALNSATTTVSNAGAYPYNNMFDPSSQFDISIDLAGGDASVGDGGAWDAYDPAVNMAVDDMFTLQWAQWVHEGELT